MKEFYKSGSFKDFAGSTHKFVVCGVVYRHTDGLMLGIPVKATDIDTKEERMLLQPVKEYNNDGHLNESLFLGVAICSPRDEYDEEIGKAIAKGKALKGKRAQRWMSSNLAGMFADNVIEAIVANEVEYVATHPEEFIAGYVKAAEKHSKTVYLQKEYAKLTDKEKELVQLTADRQVYLPAIYAFAKMVNSVGGMKTLAAPEPTEAIDITTEEPTPAA